MKRQLSIAAMLVLLALLLLVIPASAGKPPPAPLAVSGCYLGTMTLVRNTCPYEVPAVTTDTVQIDQVGTTISLTTSDGPLGSGTYNTTRNTFSATGTVTTDPCPAGMTCTYTTSGQFAQAGTTTTFSGTGKATVYAFLGIPICYVTMKMAGTKTGPVPDGGCFLPPPSPSPAP